ncbi:unnamed protein product [Amoebophrya sp. A120]|nr:unnamed protein product [Amoebophrya sp. A120]|eukprot:GSA120T00019103001.1
MHALGIPIFIPSVELLWQFHLNVQVAAKYSHVRNDFRFMATPLDRNKIDKLVTDGTLELVSDWGKDTSDRVELERNPPIEQETKRTTAASTSASVEQSTEISNSGTNEIGTVKETENYVIANQEMFWFPHQERAFAHTPEQHVVRKRHRDIIPGNRTQRMQFAHAIWMRGGEKYDVKINRVANKREREPRKAVLGIIANEILASMHPAGNTTKGFDGHFPENEVVLSDEDVDLKPHVNCTRFCPQSPNMAPWRMFETKRAFYYWLGKLDLYHWGPHVRTFHNVSHLFSMIKDHELLDAMRRRQLQRSTEMNDRAEHVFRTAMGEILGSSEG